MKVVKDQEGRELSIGNTLRHELFNKITPILLGSDQIHDSTLKMMIQACCLDMVSAVESLIKNHDLDSEKKSEKNQDQRAAA